MIFASFLGEPINSLAHQKTDPGFYRIFQTVLIDSLISNTPCGEDGVP
jgi:hypothetical protein